MGETLAANRTGPRTEHLRDTEQTWRWAGHDGTDLYPLTSIGEVENYPVQRRSHDPEADAEPFGEDKMVDGVESRGEVE